MEQNPQPQKFAGPQFTRPTGGTDFTAPAFDPRTVQYVRNTPSTVEEAMAEMDRRIVQVAQLTGGQVDIKRMVFDLLTDFENGIQNRSNIIVPKFTL